MIPERKKTEINEINKIETSKTYLINFDKEKIQNKIDGIEAIKQAVKMILSTERSSYTIYPLDYGVTLEKYIGQPLDYIEGDIDREIKESLLKDSRILDVINFEYENDKDVLKITFTVVSIFGEFSQEVLI